MKILVLTSEPITADALRAALDGNGDLGRAEVMVVAPALADNPLKFWFSDADEAIERAQWVRRESVEQLGEAGVSAVGDTGESDPLTAIQDALQTFAADRILLVTAGDRYREDLDADEVEDRFGVPVTRVSTAG